MPRVIAGVLVLFVASSALAQIKPEPGLVISKSGSLRRGTYLVPNSSEDPYTAAITIQGDNLVVDFKGATIQGTTQDTLPDQRKGTGIRVIGSNVVIKNAKVRGYKVGLIAKDAPGIRILDSDFSYNWKQHLKSTLERENEDDWMSYHQNDKDEWLRYGAGIYLNGCEGFEVRKCTVTGGQCALMVVKSNKGLAWNNDFSFNSGIGLGLYRSNDNRIMHNAMDWCVRGYSHGRYNRGQDSAGILVYEQSNRNLFAYNSATHGGDGFFLWAGQSTMDTGQGGCNDNVVFGNDFSHAPANAIEATFSRNTFANNYLRESNYGVWGGYSYGSTILGNWILDNGVGVAIEHGQENAIRTNYFRNNQQAIKLWQNATQDPNWGYPKNHDTKSHDYKIEGNVISRSDAAFDLKDTSGVSITGSQIQLAGELIKRQGSLEGLTFTGNKIIGGAPDPKLSDGNTFEPLLDLNLVPEWDPYARDKSYPEALRAMRPERLKGGMTPFLPEGAIRGRYAILVDEWGPYDYRYPRLWPEPSGVQTVEKAGREPQQARVRVQKFRVLGPAGKWRVKDPKNATNVRPLEGFVPGEIEVTLPEGASNVKVDLEYTTDHDTFDYLGRRKRANDIIPFGWERFYAPIAWNVRLFEWDDKTDPRTKPEAFAKLIAGDPVISGDFDALQFGTSGAFAPNGPRDHFATVSKGTVDLPEGSYRLYVTSDDGCRVYVDGKRVIDEWHYQGPTTFDVSLSPGKHEIRIEHFEIDGYAAIAAEIRKA